jgi:hypothetical protein
MIILSSSTKLLILLKTQKGIDQTVSLHPSFSLSTQITFTPLPSFPAPPSFSITLIILSCQKKKKFVGFHQIAPLTAD